MTGRNQGRKLICWLFGHKPEDGRLKHSPYTVFTHWRDTDCQRCGKHLKTETLYIDALSRPDLFKTERTK